MHKAVSVELIRLFSGILEREQEQSVVYGSVDFGKTVVTNEKYKELVNICFCWGF
jgi:predicted ATP-dependent Lon-type protease